MAVKTVRLPLCKAGPLRLAVLTIRQKSLLQRLLLQPKAWFISTQFKSLTLMMLTTVLI